VPDQEPQLTAEFLSWHAQLCFDQGTQYAYTQVLGINDEVTELARQVWVSPTFALLEEQRQPVHEPCRLLSCHGRCSRCIHAATWHTHGPYPGNGAL
jgi:hypothetical protein